MALSDADSVTSRQVLPTGSQTEEQAKRDPVANEHLSHCATVQCRLLAFSSCNSFMSRQIQCTVSYSAVACDAEGWGDGRQGDVHVHEPRMGIAGGVR